MTRPTSSAPIILAAGVMLALWGAVSAWLVSVIGVTAIGYGALRWAKEARRTE